jgi:uncharacterized protein YndB with AHSA1/START domain
MTQFQKSVDGQATTVKRIFSRKTSVAIDIAAPVETIWALLTDADGFKAWNSTLIELTGAIAPGGKIARRSKLAPDRIFKLKVKNFDAPKKLSWGDAMGTRTYMLTPTKEGKTRFDMTEIIGGPIFPLFAGFIPSFDESFEQFAVDLKRAAESRS